MTCFDVVQDPAHHVHDHVWVRAVLCCERAVAGQLLGFTCLVFGGNAVACFQQTDFFGQTESAPVRFGP